MDFRNKTACVICNGMSMSWAERLAREFGRVFYYCPSWIGAFPTINRYRLGAGLKGVEVIHNLEPHIDEIDLFVVLDVYLGDLTVGLRKRGKRVWGAGDGENLELYRGETKEMMQKLGFPVQPWRRIVGIDALRSYLKDPKNKDKYVKVSVIRGSMESFGHKTWDMSKDWLRVLEAGLGPAGEDQEFIVEDAIPDAQEIGYDGFYAGGYPKESLWGIEKKDLGYLGVATAYDKLPKQVIWVNEHAEGFLKHVNYRQFISTEIRVPKDDKPYVVDWTCRNPSPPGELYQEIIANCAEMFWEGAEGRPATLKWNAKYGIQLIIHSSWAEKNWQGVSFPDSISQWVKLHNEVKIGKTFYVAPQDYELRECGCVIGIGDTLLDAVKQTHEHVKQVKGYQVETYLDAIPEVLKDLAKAEKEHGSKFGDDPLPSEQEVMKVLSE